MSGKIVFIFRLCSNRPTERSWTTNMHADRQWWRRLPSLFPYPSYRCTYEGVFFTAGRTLFGAHTRVTHILARETV